MSFGFVAVSCKVFAYLIYMYSVLLMKKWPLNETTQIIAEIPYGDMY